MTAAAPSPYRSPIAGLFNALVALAIRLLDLKTVQLEAEVAVATAENEQLKNNQSQGGTA